MHSNRKASGNNCDNCALFESCNDMEGQRLGLDDRRSRHRHAIWTTKRMFVRAAFILGWLSLSTVPLLYCFSYKTCELPSLPYYGSDSSLTNLQRSPVNGDKDMVHRLVVITYVRSGSSFLGDLLSANPAIFYHYEPLHMYSPQLRLHGKNLEKARDTVSNLFNCNFENEPEYLEHSRPIRSFIYNRYLWHICRGIVEVCHHVAYVSKVCSQSKVHIMKIAHMSVLQFHHWMNLNEDFAKTMKVVHLVRDPRGLWASRRDLGWCKRSLGCASAKALCQQMREDLNNFESLERDYPGRTVRVRHEDIASDPFNQSRDLYARLGLNFSEHVIHFLRTHTKGANENELLNPYSTKRDSIKTVSRWTEKLNMTEVLMVQESCYDVMIRLGYTLA